MLIEEGGGEGKGGSGRSSPEFLVAVLVALMVVVAGCEGRAGQTRESGGGSESRTEDQGDPDKHEERPASRSSTLEAPESKEEPAREGADFEINATSIPVPPPP